VILAAWQRWLLFVIVPLLVSFLALQLLRWIIPRQTEPAKPDAGNDAFAEGSEAIQAERDRKHGQS
jgi:hypothetical protein